jgi:hypothetical protein
MVADQDEFGSAYASDAWSQSAGIDSALAKVITLIRSLPPALVGSPPVRVKPGRPAQWRRVFLRPAHGYEGSALEFACKTGAFPRVKANKSDDRPALKMGYWTQAGSDLCLLATHGYPQTLSAAVRQFIIEPTREHRHKPARIHADVERLVARPLLELFARDLRPSLVSWGDQLGAFQSGCDQNDPA